MNKPIAGFDQYWLELRAPGLDTQLETDGILESLALPKGAKIFDAGCGPGRIGNELARRGFEVLGVDLSPEMIAMARAENAGGASYMIGDYLDMPGQEDDYRFWAFDAVLSWHTSWGYDTHGRNVAFFARAAKLLKSGGKLLLQAWNPLGLQPRTSNVFRAKDGTMIAEMLEFSPETLVISIDRSVIGPNLTTRESGHCHTYTYRDIRHWMLAGGFAKVEALAVPVNHPWQVILGEAM